MVFHCPLYHFRKKKHGQSRREEEYVAQAGVSDSLWSYKIESNTLTINDTLVLKRQ